MPSHDLAERFNDYVEFEAEGRKLTKQKRKPRLPKPIDLEVARRGAQDTAVSHVSLFVDIARAEAHEMMGEKRQALAVAERHLSNASGA